MKLGSNPSGSADRRKQAVADVVERPGPDPRRGRARSGPSSRETISRAARAGEGDEQDRVGGHAPGDQVGDPVGDDPRLARPRAGEDQVVAVGGGRRGELGRVQVAGELLGRGGRRRSSGGGSSACGPVRSARLESGIVPGRSTIRPRRDLTAHSTKEPGIAVDEETAATTILRDPRVYLVGRQQVDEAALAAFLADHEVATGRPTPTRRARSSSRSPAGSAT